MCFNVCQNSAKLTFILLKFDHKAFYGGYYLEFLSKCVRLYNYLTLISTCKIIVRGGFFDEIKLSIEHVSA